MSKPPMSKNRKLADEIANKLGESDKKPRRQIENIINRCGVDFAQTVLKDTLEIEADGGMMIKSGDRRRTPGGVFFHLARERMPEELRDEIFYSWRTASKKRARYESQFPAFEWDKRSGVIDQLKAAAGKVEEVNIQLIGRPGEIDRRENLVVTTMDFQFSDALVLPTGVPDLPSGWQTYTVYISAKQWEKVESAIQRPDDTLIVDGYVAYDAETDSVAVYTTYVTTKKLRRKDKKQSRKDSAQAGQVRKAQRMQKSGASGGGHEPAPVDEEPEEPAPVVVLDLPDDLPQDVAQKLTELHTAAASFRQKIGNLEAKPEGQQFGLEMTQKLLKNTEQQIEKLEKQYLTN